MKKLIWLTSVITCAAVAAGSIALLYIEIEPTFHSGNSLGELPKRSRSTPLPPERLNLVASRVIHENTETAQKQAVVVIPDAKGSNLLANGSFESDPQNNPPYWKTSAPETGHIAEWSPEQHFDGYRALKISAVSPAIDGWPGWFATLNHRPGAGYDFTAKYFTPDGAGAWLGMTFFDRGQKFISGISSGCPRRPSTGRWALVKLTAERSLIPSGTVRIMLGLQQCLNFTRGRRTVLYYDDASLVMTGGG
ncbi:MAG: hypothetical protein ACU833_10230, partial [Gammaproteobacteria bacterium]